MHAEDGGETHAIGRLWEPRARVGLPVGRPVAVEGRATAQVHSLSLPGRLQVAHRQWSLAEPLARVGAAGGGTLRCPEPDLLRGDPSAARLCAWDRPSPRLGPRWARAPPGTDPPNPRVRIPSPGAEQPWEPGAAACPRAAADGCCGPVGAALGILLLRTQADCPPDGTAYSLRNI